MASKCIYCNGASNDPNWSLEHIWPSALGGKLLEPSVFQTRQVCKTCNDLCGQWVDGAFLKSWFVKAESANAALRLLDPMQPQALPLMYMGIDTAFPVQDGEVCERWIGPAGAQIYHVHLADDEKWDGFAGGDPIRRKRNDPGRAFLALTSTSQFWAQCAILSFAEYFSRSFKIAATELGGDQLVPGLLNGNDETLAKHVREEALFIVERSGHHRYELSVNLGFSDRFLCKLALGIGSNVLGPSYTGSAYADQLRRGLWAQRPEVWDEIEIRGTSFLGGEDDLSHTAYVSVPGAWVICLQAFATGFGFNVFSPEGRNLAALISDVPPTENVRRKYGDGAFYVVAPQRARAFGPISGLQYVSHKIGRSRNPDLELLQSWEIAIDQLPPMTRT